MRGALIQAVKLIDAGHADRLDRYCAPWTIRMVALQPDVALEGGGLLPWRAGALYDQPHREVLAIRLIRSEWSRRREKRLKAARK
jgi:hypothetical protein